MPADPLKLKALAAVAISDATARLASGGSRQAFDKEMRAIIARSQTAAYVAGTAQRLGIPLDSPLLSRARLSKAERADITQAVAGQLKYLDDFVAGMDDMSDAAIAARANMYAGASRATYYKSATEADLPAYPGDGSSECLGNCGCSWEQGGDGYSWIRGKTDSCATCLRRESEWAPYTGGGE